MYVSGRNVFDKIFKKPNKQVFQLYHCNTMAAIVVDQS
jgi:hypothetical protein